MAVTWCDVTLVALFVARPGILFLALIPQRRIVTGSSQMSAARRRGASWYKPNKDTYPKPHTSPWSFSD
ncbi:hypothetical protein BJX76DRAFT_327239 [Aspergillus varians]